MLKSTFEIIFVAITISVRSKRKMPALKGEFKCAAALIIRYSAVQEGSPALLQGIPYIPYSGYISVVQSFVKSPMK